MSKDLEARIAALEKDVARLVSANLTAQEAEDEVSGKMVWKEVNGKMVRQVADKAVRPQSDKAVRAREDK